jgi:hypothetical protein
LYSTILSFKNFCKLILNTFYYYLANLIHVVKIRRDKFEIEKETNLIGFHTKNLCQNFKNNFSVYDGLVSSTMLKKSLFRLNYLFDTTSDIKLEDLKESGLMFLVLFSDDLSDSKIASEINSETNGILMLHRL